MRRDDNYQVFRNACPRNCYGTCGILSYVKDGRLVKVEGDPKHGYTLGRLCAKGYALTQYVYHPQRLRYPLRQTPRGSGRFERISWDAALDIIGRKFIELNERYGSNLALGYNKFSGNLGLLHYAIEGFFASVGSHTHSSGDLCQSAGHDAQLYDFGKLRMPDPEYMARAKNIVLWGSNAAVTAVQQWFFINRARDWGGKLVVIDPVYTTTSAQGDLYLQINPGTDGLLALGVCKLLMAEGAIAKDFLKNHTSGFDEFRDYLDKKITLDQVVKVTGIPLEGIKELAAIYRDGPVATWIGFGLQRHVNGGQNARGINALAAISGQLGQLGGGVYYINTKDCFPFNIHKLPGKLRQEKAGKNRGLNLASFPKEALTLTDPPLKALWIACRNPLSQDPEPKYWHELFQRLELTVVVDLFMTETAKYADLVLPAASFFEGIDLNFSYWHNWVSFNEQAIKPFYESKSDLEIIRLLAAKLNELKPGFSSFPYELTELDWIEKELTQEVKKLLGIKHWRELLKRPRKLALTPVPWQDGIFDTPSGKYEFFSKKALEDGLPPLPEYLPRCEPKSKYPLQLLTTRRLKQLHSQYGDLPWLAEDEVEGIIYLNPETAKERGLVDGDLVDIFNAHGLLVMEVAISSNLPKNLITFSKLPKGISFNELINARSADMGSIKTSFKGNAFYSAYVDIIKHQGGVLHDQTIGF